jgi:hypothetical protein
VDELKIMIYIVLGCYKSSFIPGEWIQCLLETTDQFSAGDLAQVVKHLPNKRDALSSNSRTTKKKKNGKKYMLTLRIKNKIRF